MRTIGIFGSVLLLSLVFPQAVNAHIPVVVGTPDQHDITEIEEPEVSHAFYGKLNNHPHTYEFTTQEPINLFVEILVPDTPSQENNISGTVFRVLPRGSIEEVAGLPARDASWESFFEFFGGDHYRRGSSFEGAVAEGTYRVEVSTPDNIGKYVLVVGSIERGSGGYFSTIRDLAQVKLFLGKSQFAVIGSPFVYVPLTLLLMVSIAILYIRRKIKR